MQTEQTTQPNFANYTWFKGTKKEYNAASVATHDGRIYLGLKGFDKKQNGAGYISAAFEPEELERLAGHISAILSEPGVTA